MSKLQTADVVLALGGDRRNTVPKYAVTAAEVAVLRYIHGEDAVFDINVHETPAERTHRQEIGRLAQAYGRQDGERRFSPAVDALFPGAAARVFETFDELDLPEDFYLATERRVGTQTKTVARAAKAESDDVALKDMTLKELQATATKHGVDLAGVTRKADIIEAIETHLAAAPAESEDEADDEDDGVEEMPDNLFK